MRLLILGGTVFLGRHIVEAALARGHEVTLFNRGEHNADLYPELEKLRGDRDGNLTALEGRTWDAVVDTCGYVPRIVGDSARLLADAVEHYTFISSISVYPDFSLPKLDEQTPVGTMEDETVEEITGETYGPLKALCEQAAEEAMPGRVLHVRAGLIVGPHDGSDRFSYWPHRIAKGGRVLAPGSGASPVQFVDVRDLAAWVVLMAEQRKAGVYNATGPADTLTMGQCLETIRTVVQASAHSQQSAEFQWVSEEFLIENEVGPYVEMPLWVPVAAEGIDRADCSKAIGDGLTFRSLEETVTDTLDWLQTLPADRNWRAGLTPERESELLAKLQ